MPHRRDDVANLVLGHEWVGAPIETAIHNVVGTGKLAADAIGMVSERGLPREVAADDRPGLDARCLEMVTQSVAHVTRAAQHGVAEGCGRNARVVPNERELAGLLQGRETRVETAGSLAPTLVEGRQLFSCSSPIAALISVGRTLKPVVRNRKRGSLCG